MHDVSHLQNLRQFISNNKKYVKIVEENNKVIFYQIDKTYYRNNTYTSYNTIPEVGQQREYIGNRYCYNRLEIIKKINFSSKY